MVQSVVLGKYVNHGDTISMKKTFAAFIVAMFAFLVSSCDWDFSSMHSGAFDFNLRGTWVSNNHNILGHTEGKLVITVDTIRIEGFELHRDFPYADIPFAGIARRVELTGFSEDNMLFINRPGFVGGIPYVIDHTTRPVLLYLDFGFGLDNRVILQRQ